MVVASNAGAENPSRHELVLWVNKSLESNFTKVEELCTGAAYCQFMDMMFPGSVPLKKVKFLCNQEHEYIYNFKLMQAAFTKVGVDKMVYIEKLVKGKYQDNFEFLQWFRKFFDTHFNGREYDPKTARNGEPIGIKKVLTNLANPSGSFHRLTPTNESKRTRSQNLRTKSRCDKFVDDDDGRCSSAPKIFATFPNCVEKKSCEMNELKNLVNELQLTIESVQKERDFYFTKLRKIEILCQEKELDGQKIIEILYETQEGFASPELDISEGSKLSSEQEEEENLS